MFYCIDSWEIEQAKHHWAAWLTLLCVCSYVHMDTGKSSN